MIIYPKLISFEKLQISDLPLMHTWLNESHVHEWYDKDKKNTIEEIAERYSPKINKDKPSDDYLVLYDEKKIAYIQTYKVNDWPEFGKYVEYDDHTASVDLFIGETAFLGKGFGSMMLKKFLKDIVFTNADISTCIIGPEPNNKRAIKSYEKAGFTYKKTIQIPNESEPTYIMELRK